MFFTEELNIKLERRITNLTIVIMEKIILERKTEYDVAAKKKRQMYFQQK